MEFHDWINLVVDEWTLTGRSETQLAKAIGINQATLNSWKNKTRGLPRDSKIIQALISYFKESHPEVYDVLKVPRPDVNNPRHVLLSNGFPTTFIDELLAAREEFTAELAKRGISQDSPEAREIIAEAFSRHGISFTFTE